MKLIKTSIFSAIITIFRIASGFIATKIVSVLTGPSGVALLGAFSNFISIVFTFANGAINSGVVKYTSELNGDEQKLHSLFSTSLKISVICSLITGLIILILAPNISDWLFENHIFINPIRLLGISVLFYSINSLLISILNGKGLVTSYTIVNLIGSLIGLLLTITLVFFYKIEGALYALVLSQSLIFFITILLISKSSWFSINFFKKSFNKSIALKLSHFSLMSIVSTLTLPIAQIYIRKLIISKFDINQAGIWQAMMRISDGYLAIITSALGIYYLPKLASINSEDSIRREIFSGYKLLVPIILICSVCIYLFRFFIIKLLYTSTFIIMEDLFFWQLLGDFFKIMSWVLSYLMLAKAMTKVYIFTEILFSLFYVFITYLLIDLFLLKSVVIAFAFNYFVYFLFMMVYFRNILFEKFSHKKSNLFYD